MASITYPASSRTHIPPMVLGWVAAASVLATLLAFLTANVMDNRVLIQDQSVLDSVSGWDFPGLSSLFGVVSLFTGSKAGLIYGLLGIVILLLLGKTREAVVFGVVGFTIAAVAILGDYTLGQLVDRGRPLAGATNSTPAFPSGHVFGSTVFFGFIAFLAVYYRLKKPLLVPLLAVLAAMVLLVGPARVYEQAHWPSDVAAGYLLGGLWLLILIPAFTYARTTKRMNSFRQSADMLAEDCVNCRTERSIASVVWLDPERGTATKVYTPPLLVRLLYWLAFQARFPYVSNQAALQAGIYRRKVAGLITRHRFGKDLVAPVLNLNNSNGRYEFVTEFVPGDKVENDEAAKKFLAQVSDTFSAAGLSVWQVNPHNPHAHTNLIRTHEGDYKIIDLESALVTPFLPKGQRNSALKAGNFPVFDDIDFPKMHGYFESNKAALEASLGSGGLTELNQAVIDLEECVQRWKKSEPRIWGHIISRIYKLLDWKSYFQQLSKTVSGAEKAAEQFLNSAIDRWETEGRIGPSDTADLRSRLASAEARSATRHLGAHLVLSVAVAIPIPGARSLARFLWTFAFWAKAQVTNIRFNGSGNVLRDSNIHTPLVMVLALIPGLGSVAYFASRPLRRKLLVRLLLDEVAWKLPFRLYARMHLGRLLPPPPATQVSMAH